jgi:heavy metal translocating P-type ATPase
MEVTRIGSGTVLARMIRMVHEAQSGKAPIQRLADRVAGIFVPLVIGVALLTLILWALLSPDSSMVFVAPVAVLLVACPCAMGLATPTAILVGTGRAARMGILFRSGGILERLTKATTFVFDKTGTLTEGRPIANRLIPAEGVSIETLLQYSASAEQYSEHPFGKAICAKARREGIKFLTATEHENRPGLGLRAIIEGREILIGSRAFVEGSGIPEDQRQMMKRIGQDEGMVVVYIAADGDFMGAIVFTDSLKSGAAATVEELQARGLETIMLTGDNAYSAASTAAKLGIKHIEADALPETKLTTIRSLRQTGRTIVMVGDGVNDAAALAAADIGISLGSGTDIAVKSSDITITGQSLDALLSALDMSKATLRIIKQNLFWAFIYNVLMIPIAAGIFYPIFGLALSPEMAAGAMALSSIFVVTNSLRLKKREPTKVVSLSE